MTLPIAAYLNTMLPIETGIQQAMLFLESCEWQLEIEEGVLIGIPKEVELFVRSRAFVLSEDKQIAFGNHFQAIVEIGREGDQTLYRAKYGVLRIYFNLAGKMISEDRFSINH